MAITREQHVAIWKHLLTVVLPKHTEDDNLWQLLGEHGIDNVTDLMGDPATADEMALWEYEYASIDDKGDAIKDSSGKPIMIQYRIKRFEVNQIFILKDYIWKEAIKQGFKASSQMQHEHYIALTSEGYDLLRTDPTYTMRRERILVDTSTANATDVNNAANNTAPNTNKFTSNLTAIEQFQRSIKRDMSLFPQLKNDEQFERWNRATITQANIQDVGEVLNHAYAPIDQGDKDLFARKLTFMYGVFELSLLTDKGKEIVRKYEDTRDSQSVYKEVKKHYTDSVKARIDSEKYLKYITTKRLDETWTGTATAFVIHWREQVRLYNGLVPTDRRQIAQASQCFIFSQSEGSNCV